MWNGAWRASAHTPRQPCAANLLREGRWLQAAEVLSHGDSPSCIARFSRSFTSTLSRKEKGRANASEPSSSSSPPSSATTESAEELHKRRTLSTGDGVSFIDYQVKRQQGLGRKPRKQIKKPSEPSLETIALRKKMARLNNQDVILRRLREKWLAAEQKEKEANDANAENGRTTKADATTTPPAAGVSDDSDKYNFGRIMKEQEEEDSAKNKADTNIGHLGSLYPSNTRLGAKEWATLHRTIREGFTSNQLSSYFNTYQKNNAAKMKSTADGHGSDDIEEWAPLLNILFDVQGLRADIIPPSFKGLRQRLKGKYGLTERILRQCWNLSLRGDIGQLNVTIPTDKTDALLSNEAMHWLRNLADTYNAKIDIFRDDRIVRITAGEESAAETKRVILDRIFMMENEKVTDSECNECIKL